LDSVQLAFPLIPKKGKSLLTEVSRTLGIDYIHSEKDIVDYSVQRTVPHKLTQNGPCLAVGDMNGDTYEDFIVGSSATYSPVVFFQDSEGTFTQKQLFDSKQDKAYEEEGIVLFDLDADGDLDLYLVSGSNEFEIDSELYEDRVLMNDGKGNFSRDENTMPKVQASGSVVKANDYNKDGLVDVFVGGRTPTNQYPLADKSFLLKNENGLLSDVTDTIAPGLRNVGMVTDAVWSDFDGDGKEDLIIVGELMPITFFRNEGNSFKKLEKTGIEDYLGWWESIVSKDVDNDGDLDLVVGNMGANNFLSPSDNRPVTLVAKDFDANGSLDPLTFSYFKNRKGDYESYPVSFWGDINNQSRLFRGKFDLYKEYAQATEKTLLTEAELKDALVLKGNYDKSAYVENLGNGTYAMHALPIEAQVAPLNDLVLTDIDEDGNLDILGIGNNYGNETFVGRYDAFNGIVLKGNGKGSFRPVGPLESGFVVPGDAKAMVQIDRAQGGHLYVATQNRGPILIFEKNDATSKDLDVNISSVAPDSMTKEK